MIYQFKSGAHVSSKLDPQACGEFIVRLGSRAPADVVEASRDESAPTHAHFSWEITGDEAKQRVWEQEAGQLIRSIVVIREDRPESTPLPAFVSIVAREADERSYLPTYEALGDEDYRKQVLAEARAALAAWRRRYRDLEELARVFEAIDQLELQAAS